jgi:hypothetical protein
MGAPAQAENAQCGTCIFFDMIQMPQSVGVYESNTEAARPGPVFGVCRRFPPRAAVIENRTGGMLDHMGRWPLVPDDLWCGEFKEELA